MKEERGVSLNGTDDRDDLVKTLAL